MSLSRVLIRILASFFPTDPFKISELQHQEISKFYVLQERFATDFVDPKLWKGRSGWPGLACAPGLMESLTKHITMLEPRTIANPLLEAHTNKWCTVFVTLALSDFRSGLEKNKNFILVARWWLSGRNRKTVMSSEIVTILSSQHYFVPKNFKSTILPIHSTPERYQTNRFTVLEPENPMIDIFEFHKACQSTDFDSLKLRKGRSGSVSRRS